MKAVEKYNTRAEAAQSLLCVGLDSEITRIPTRYRELILPQFEFNRAIIEATHTYTAAYKMNMAFYEARGEDGLRELRLTMQHLQTHHPDIFTICDAKRADISSTNKAYAGAIFDSLSFDAVTLHPYMGQEALQPFLEREDKACIILCRTSNPGAGEIQDLSVDGKPLWQLIAEKASTEWNGNQNCMLVVGATYPDELRQVRAIAADITLLVPGVGTQGGEAKAVVQAGLNQIKKGLIINSSRGIIFSDYPAEAARTLRDLINQYR